MIVGKRYRVRPEFNTRREYTAGPPCQMVGTCIWVHPRRRFAVLAFRVPGGVLRQCFRREEMVAV